MSYQFYYPVVPISSVESPVSVVANPWDGYNWYQSHPSSEVMAASPCSCGCQTPISQITAGKPNLHYPIEYRPPEPPPLLSLGNSPDITLTSYLSPSHSHLIYSPPQSSNIHTAEFCAPYMYTPSFTLTCHTTLSSGQPYYALELANPITTPTLSQIPERKYVSCDEKVNGDASESVSFKGCGDACVGDRDKLQMESQLKPGVAVVGTVGRNYQADTSKLVKEAVEIQGELIVDAIEVEPQVFDKSPVRISNLVVETVCEDDWNNDDDSFIRMNLTIFQHSSPIMGYVTEYMRIKSRAEFKFKCYFEDPLLAYCFVEGLDEDIREALELWAPQTLQEAIYLATFQELWIDESSLVESIVRKSDERLVEDGLFVDNYGVEIDSDVLAIDSNAKSTPLVEGLVSFLSDSSMFGEVAEFSAEGIQGLEYMMHVTDLDETYNINLGHKATGVDCIDTKGEIAVDSIESKEATEGKQTENIGGIVGCNGKSQLRTPTKHSPCFSDPLFYLQEGNFLKSHDSCMIENSRLHFGVENQIYAIEEYTGDVPSYEANPMIFSMPNIGHIWGLAYEDNFILEGNRVTYVADKKCNYLKNSLNENSFVNQQEKRKKLLRQMVAVCMEPSAIIHSACRRMTTYKNVKEIHGYLLKSGIIMNLRVQNALTDIFYEKLEWEVDLYWVLLKSSNKDIDWITHAAILYACRTAIRVEVDKSFCKCIRSPKVAFCSLMVALLARAGLIDEARNFIEEKQIARHVVALQTFLAGCRINQCINVRKRVIEQLCDLEPRNAENYATPSTLYAYAGNIDMVEELRETIRVGTAEVITKDHRVSQEEEKKGIEDKEGYVEMHRGASRVHRVLSISRSIGDALLKNWVPVEPNTMILPMTPDMEYLVLASDGLLEQVGNQEAIDIFYEPVKNVDSSYIKYVQIFDPGGFI